MTLAATAPTPLTALRELLEGDKRASMQWTDADFKQRVDLVCRLLIPGSGSWVVPLEETIDAWRDAYMGRPSKLSQLGPGIADQEPGERHSTIVV